MTAKGFALLMGIAFLVVGIAGFIPPMLTPADNRDHQLHVTAFDGYLFGLFHVNALHSGVHVLFGVLGAVMSRNGRSAKTYAMIVFVSYALLAVMGLIPVLNTVFGLIPIHGHDVWLHAVIAAAAGYFALVAPPGGSDRATAVDATDTRGTASV